MCGRYALRISIEELIEKYGISKKGPDINPRDEIFPTDIAPVVVENRGQREIRQYKWGFNLSFTNKLIINARGETIEKKNVFKKAFLNQRCIIPATAFFEWKKEGRKKTKYRIFLKDNTVISLAGIFDTFTFENGEMIDCFTIITTSPSEQLNKIHDRMPVILQKEEEKYWLDNYFYNLEYLKQVIKPYPGELIIQPENNQLSLDFNN